MAADSTIQQVLDGEARWCIHHGDMLDAMPLIPDNSVDAVCCDAPYGLGEEPDIAMLMRAWLDDTDAKAGKAGFMGRKWDVVPGPRYWRECFRILKPGGYLLTFAGTRTQDLMGMAIRLAGFEIRDTLAWLYSQGMSKNVNIERQIAMHQCTLPGRHFASTLPKGAKARPGDHLCPETEDSVKWNGQGSALAPSHEPIIVARKPLRGTYAENTLEYGTAMNIDATRIAHAGAKDFEQHKAGVETIKARGGSMDQSWKNSSDLSGASEVTTAGRWPKNVLLQHSSILWHALRDSLTEEEERIVYDYFGIREAVRALREDDIRHAIQDQETEVLLEGVRWCRAFGEEKGDQEDRVGIPDVQTLWGVENHACGGEETPKRKPRVEVASQAIPWWLTRLFVPVARTGCQRIGTTQVGANPTWDTPNRDTEPSAFTGERVSKVRHGRAGEASAERRYNENGSTSFAATPGPRRDAVEDVAVYRCVEGCPVKLLAEQSDELGISSGRNRDSGGSRGWGNIGRQSDGSQTGKGDSGTAARYFQQFHTSEFDEPFLYHSKPSRREKDAGLQHFRPRSAAEATDSKDGQERLNNARTGAGRTGGARNPHPTTKSIEVCRWMVRLVARPGQLVCVPFAGSGSECVGALLEGCQVIGVELMDTDDEPFVSVARARCEHIDGREFVPRESLQPKREAEKPRQGFLF